MLVAPDKRIEVDVSPVSLERMATDRTISADLSKVCVFAKQPRLACCSMSAPVYLPLVACLANPDGCTSSSLVLVAQHKDWPSRSKVTLRWCLQMESLNMGTFGHEASHAPANPFAGDQPALPPHPPQVAPLSVLELSARSWYCGLFTAAAPSLLQSSHACSRLLIHIPSSPLCLLYPDAPHELCGLADRVHVLLRPVHWPRNPSESVSDHSLGSGCCSLRQEQAPVASSGVLRCAISAGPGADWAWWMAGPADSGAATDQCQRKHPQRLASPEAESSPSSHMGVCCLMNGIMPALPPCTACVPGTYWCQLGIYGRRISMLTQQAMTPMASSVWHDTPRSLRLVCTARNPRSCCAYGCCWSGQGPPVQQLLTSMRLVIPLPSLPKTMPPTSWPL